MRKRRAILVIAGVALAAVVTVLVWPGEKEPEYQGKQLSWWIRGAGAFNQPADLGERRQRNDAVRAIGTNGLPILIEWIGSGIVRKETKLEVTVNKINNQLGAWLEQFRSRKLRRAGDAIYAFSVLGKEARPAVPELVRLKQSMNEGVGVNAATVLMIISEGDMKLLSRWLNSADKSAGSSVTNSDLAVPQRSELNGLGQE